MAILTEVRTTTLTTINDLVHQWPMLAGIPREQRETVILGLVD
jgi:hypothetical protein